jgi:hypothetical protein
MLIEILELRVSEQAGATRTVTLTPTVMRELKEITIHTGHVTGDPWMRFPDLALPLAGRPGHGQLRYGAFIHFVLSASAVR